MPNFSPHKNPLEVHAFDLAEQKPVHVIIINF